VAEDQPYPSGKPDDDAAPAGDPTGPAQPDPDATRISGPDPDATRIERPQASGSDPTQPIDPDATRAVPGADPDATRAVPPAETGPTIRPQTPDPTTVLPQTPSAWRGSAAPRPPRPDEDQTGIWDPAQAPGRAWWLPILLGVVGLLILIGLAFALVIAMRNNTTTPLPTTPPAPASPTVATTAPTSPSAAPSTPATPSPTPSFTGAVVAVPDNLVDLLTLDAENELIAAGLKYNLIPQVDPSVLENTVLAVNPPSGTKVKVGSTVDVIYAVPAPSASPSPSPSPSGP
jgi:hypothetical protein